MNELVLTTKEQQRLRRQLAQTRDVQLYRRLLAILEVAHGRSITEVAQMLGVTRQSIYNWVEAYRRERAPTALYDAPRSGRPRLWSEKAERFLQELLTTQPDHFGRLATTWTVPLLQGHLERHTGQRFSSDTIRRQLERMGYVWKRPRYRLESDPEREKKTLHSGEDSAIASPERAVGRG